MSLQIEVDQQSPGGGPTITSVKAVYDGDNPDITAEEYEGARRFGYGYSWDTERLGKGDIESILEEDYRVEDETVPEMISSAGINEFEMGGEIIGIDYDRSSVRILSDGMPEDLIKELYDSSTAENTSEMVDEGLRRIQQELV